MAENRARYKLSDGRTVTVPANNAETAQKIWAQKGLQFELVTPAVPAQPDKFSATDALGHAVARGAGQGLPDEAHGFGAWLAGDTPRVTRGGAPMAPSTGYEAGRDTWRADAKQAAQEHPVVSTFGDFISALPAAIAIGGGAAGATRAIGAAAAPRVAKYVAPRVAKYVAPRVAKYAAPVLAGMIEGVAQGVGRSEATTARGVAQDAATSAGVGAGAGVVGEFIAPYVASGARAFGRALDAGGQGMRREAIRQKLAASGAERGALKELGKRAGGHKRYAEGAERLGIGENRLGVIPASVSQHADDAAAAAAKADALKNSLADQIKDAPIDGAEVAARIRALGADAGDGRAADALRAELEAHAKTFDDLGMVPFARMNLSRQTLGRQTNFDSGTLQQDVRKKVYGLLNDVMADAGERAELGVGTAWRQANEDEHIALELMERGENKLNTSGNRVLSPSDMITGAAVGIATQDFAQTAAAMGANRLIRGREHAAMYNFLNRGSQAAGATSRGVNAAADVLNPPAPSMPSVGGDALSPQRGMAADIPATRGSVPASPMARRRAAARAAQAERPPIDFDAPDEHTPVTRAVVPPPRNAQTERRPFATDAVRAGYAQPAASAAQSQREHSRETQTELDAMADPKYGAMIRAKPQSERAFTIGVLNSQDPEFRARQREAASKRSTNNAR